MVTPEDGTVLPTPEDQLLVLPEDVTAGRHHQPGIAGVRSLSGRKPPLTVCRAA